MVHNRNTSTYEIVIPRVCVFVCVCVYVCLMDSRTVGDYCYFAPTELGGGGPSPLSLSHSHTHTHTHSYSHTHKQLNTQTHTQNTFKHASSLKYPHQ